MPKSSLTATLVEQESKYTLQLTASSLPRSFVIEVEEHPGDHSENNLTDLLFLNNFNELSF
jgi:hypothetical protein